MRNTMTDEQIKTITKLMKSISHPIRFKILYLLQDQEISVGELRNQLDTTSSNITQHLNILRNQGIIDFRKDSNFIYNKITDWRIVELIKKMNQLYFSGSSGFLNDSGSNPTITQVYNSRQ